jgi:hypothetical protein
MPFEVPDQNLDVVLKAKNPTFPDFQSIPDSDIRILL